MNNVRVYVCISDVKERASRMQSQACLGFAEAKPLFETKSQRSKPLFETRSQ